MTTSTADTPLSEAGPPLVDTPLPPVAARGAAGASVDDVVVFNPATGEEIGRVPVMDAEQVRVIVIPNPES